MRFALTLSLICAKRALAITNGELDGNGHPHVGLLVASDKKGNPMWRCSGSLISETLFLTAGHCIESPAAKVAIWFDSDVESGIPQNGYPSGNGDASSNSLHLHPQYNPNAFYRHDLGTW